MTKRDFRVLVVDDDDIARDVVSSILSREGYPVVTASDGLEAINAIMTEDIGLVVTDFRMPGADGMEVLKAGIRANPETAVVIITAYGTLEAIAEGAYDYLTKPFKMQEIIIVADRAFKRAVLLRENRELRERLRETYMDVKLLKSVSDGENPCLTAEWIGRVEKLRAVNVLSGAEAEILRERLIRGNGMPDTDRR